MDAFVAKGQVFLRIKYCFIKIFRLGEKLFTTGLPDGSVPAILLLPQAVAVPPGATNGSANAKLVLVRNPGGEDIMTKKKKSLLESVPALVLLGLLAGAVGGLGIGLIQLRAAASSSSSAGK
jgi:hypothetical protein